MKKKYFILLSLILMMGLQAVQAQSEVKTVQFSGERSKAGDVTIINQKKYAKGNVGYTAFELDVPKAGNYYVSFWMIPTQEADGKPTEYAVEVNGKTITEKIVPTKCDWQATGLTNGRTIALNAGINTIAVLGNLPFLPEVETLRVSMNREKSAISSEQYDVYKNNVIAGNLNHPATPTWTRLLSSSSYPLYGQYEFGIQIYYTFITTIYLDNGTLCNVSTSSSTPHYLEVFKDLFQSPSIRTSSVNGIASYVIHSDGGFYTIRVRSTQNNVSGTSNVSISSSSSQYTNVPISNHEISYAQPTDQTYNSFLCYLSGTGDPYMELMSYNSTKVFLARSDNGLSLGGNFSWGDCPRIRKQLSIPSQYVLTFTNSSLYPTCTADIYVGFPNVPSSITDSLPNFKAGDAIASAPKSSMYNCISWSVGIWDHGRWPPVESYMPEFANCTTILERFDVFYSQYGYTRNGATESNSIIDLWEYSSGYFSHASVRKYSNSDTIPHGYDWESKYGTQERFYHPRYALTGINGYGYVAYHYIPIPNTTMCHSLFENVAEGRMVIENVSYNHAEQALINDKIHSISESKVKEMNERYEKWISAISNSSSSNIAELKNCDEYRSLLNYCKDNGEVNYILFKMLGEEEEMALYLVIDLLYEQHSDIVEFIKNENSKQTKKGDAIIYRKPIDYVRKFVKYLLAAEQSTDHFTRKNVTNELSYSDKNAFTLNTKGGFVDVQFLLRDESRISLVVYTQDGHVIDHPLNNKMLAAGSHSYSMVINNPGTYFIVYYENGTTNVKKVIIK